MQIRLLQKNLGYVVQADDGRDRFLQFESDFISLARCFGLRFAGNPELQSISVRDYLDEKVGTFVEDPGYFD